MSSFLENYCRVCPQVFCCKNCRLKHEENYHKINPECDICIYGKSLLINLSDSLLHHLESHLPLHCLYCQNVFVTSEELVLHSTCPAKQKHYNQQSCNIVITPVCTAEQSYDSPPITSIMHKSILTSSNKHFGAHNKEISLTTSTPMQKSNEREILENIPEVITPVEYSETTNTSSKVKAVSTTKPAETPHTFEQPLKRRVTFCETPIINMQSNEQRKRIKEEAPQENYFSSNGSKFSKINELDTSTDSKIVTSVQDSDQERQSSYNTASDENKFSFYTATNTKYEGDFPASEENKCKITSENDLTQFYDPENDTAWESALMESDFTKSEILSPTKNSDSLKINITPPITEKKRQEVNSSCDKLADAANCLFSEAKRDFTTKKNSDDADKKTTGDVISITNQNLIKVDIHLPVIHADLAEIPGPLFKNITEVQINPATSNFTYKADDDSVPQKHGIWSSVASLVRTVVQGLSVSPRVSKSIKRVREESQKRSKLENDNSIDASPIKKKIKLTDIRCRRTIRTIQPAQLLKYNKKHVRYVDKATQTD